MKMAKNIEHRHFNSMMPHSDFLMTFLDSPGPLSRNLFIWEHLVNFLEFGSRTDSMTKQKSYLKVKLKDSDWKRMVNVLDAMKMEYKKIIDDEFAGVAIFVFLFMEEKGKRSLSSVLLLFHNGEVLFMRNNRNKKKVKAEWKNPVDDSGL